MQGRTSSPKQVRTGWRGGGVVSGQGSRTVFRLHSVNQVMFRVILESQGYSDDRLPEKGQGIKLSTLHGCSRHSPKFHLGQCRAGSPFRARPVRVPPSRGSTKWLKVCGITDLSGPLLSRIQIRSHVKEGRSSAWLLEFTFLQLSPLLNECGY